MKEMKLKYRVICPVCSKPFDSRVGYLLNGRLVCPECRPTQYGTWVSCPPDEVDRVDERNDMKRYPDFIPENWTDCYELPLHISKYGSYAYDSHDTMALSSFKYRYNDDGDYAEGEIERVEKIISIINGEIESDFEPAWSVDEHEPARINYKGEYQFLVRGWGHLTGCGNAMNLPVEIAEKMQDGFIAYIVARLNNAQPKNGRNKIEKGNTATSL